MNRESAPARLTLDAARELLAAPKTAAAELAEIAAKFPQLRGRVAEHANITPMLADWIARNSAPPREAHDPASPHAHPARRAAPHADGGASLSEWERRLAAKEAERLRRARLEAEEELRDVVRDKARVESEVEIARQNLARAKAALDSEQTRIREAEARISEQIAARAELDDVVKILRTNIGDLEYVVEQESLAYAQAETRLAQVKREHDS
ncbi:variant leucine-rich repeat-containing protein [Leucobacter chromiiresistens]